MENYDKKLSGALFKNDKGDNPKRPDYKGSYTDGENKEFWVSSWVKQDKKGNVYLSLKMEPKESKPVNQAPDNYFAKDDTKDELPF